MAGRDEERSQGEGRCGAPTPLLCFLFSSKELVYLAEGLGQQEGLWKVIRFVVLAPFQRWFLPPRYFVLSVKHSKLLL